jgi:CHAT domain-containing protein
MKHQAKIVYPLILILILCSSLPASLHAQTREPFVAVAAAPAQNDFVQAAQLLAQGRQFLKRGQATQALPLLQDALKLFQGINIVRGEAAANDALGDLYNRQGQYKVALNFYQDASRAFNAGRDSYNANLMFAKIANMYFHEGLIDEARSALSRMNVTKPDTNPLNTAQAAQSKVGRAKGLFGRVKSIATNTPSKSTASEATSTGNATAGEIARPRELYRQFIIYSVYEIGMGRIDYFRHDLTSARKHFENALEAAGGNLPVIGKLGQARRFRVAARTSLGDIALSQNQNVAALKYYNEALAGARADNRTDLLWPAQRGVGKSLLAQAVQERDQKQSALKREEALNAYRDALKTIEAIRAGSISADESRSTFLASTKDVYDEAASALAERALMSSTAANASAKPAPLTGEALNDAAEAFRITEQSRARSLLDLLAESEANITADLPAELLKRKQANLEHQQEIAQELTGATLSNTAPTKSNEEIEGELDQLSIEYDAIENEIRTASPRYASLTAPQPLTLAEVQQKVLDKGTALLEYSLGNERSYLWAVTQEGVVLYKLPARNIINTQAQNFRAQLIPPQLQRRIAGIDIDAEQQQRGLGISDAPTSETASAFAAASNTLYKTALEPAAAFIGNKRLLIVADGALNYVPFEALVTNASSAAGVDYPTLPYLIKTNEIVYAPSASVINVLRQQTHKATGKNLLVIADPVFNDNDPRAKGKAAAVDVENGAARGLGLASAVADVEGKEEAGTPANGLQLARLTGTRIEADGIAKLARTAGGQADVWLDLDANESNVSTRDIKKYRVLHIATHGLLDASRPQFTGLILSLVGNNSGDGFLRTDEIFNLKLGSPLVMLSACETGLGKEKRGEGVIGLTRAFMYAGAPTVGVSLWSVADKSTADLMTDFYKRLLATPNAPPAEALRAAQQSMIAGKKYSAPFYWAPFILTGDWR